MTNTTIALYAAAACGVPAAALACDADSGAGNLSKLQFAPHGGERLFPARRVHHHRVPDLLRQRATGSDRDQRRVRGRDPRRARHEPRAGGTLQPVHERARDELRGMAPADGLREPRDQRTTCGSRSRRLRPVLTSSTRPLRAGSPPERRRTPRSRSTSSCTPGLALACDGDTGTGSLSLVNLDADGWVRPT